MRMRNVENGDNYGIVRGVFRRFVHWASHTFILSSRRTRNIRIGDLNLVVPPTVFHPGLFVTSKMFANYLRCQNFNGRVAAEVGTGSGILALSVACARATKVVALDINPAAVAAANENASRNSLGHFVEARSSDLFSAVPPDEKFDLIVSSPPSFSGEPKDMADRAWHAGDGYRHLKDLFTGAYTHLTENGEMLILLSSDTNVSLMESWARAAGFSWRKLASKSIGVESFIIFLLVKGQPIGARTPWLPAAAELKARYYLRERKTTEAASS